MIKPRHAAKTMLLFGAAAVSLLSAPQARAAPFFRAEELYAYCKSTGDQQTKCMVYIAAVSDVLTEGSDPGTYCRPKSTTWGDLRETFIAGYSVADASEPAAAVVLKILQEKYGC